MAVLTAAELARGRAYTCPMCSNLTDAGGLDVWGRVSRLDTDGSLQVGAGATGVQVAGGAWTTLSANEAPLMVGTFASAASGSGVALTRALVTSAFRAYADDGGANLFAAGSVPDLRAGLSRFLITHSQADSGAFTRLFGHQGQIKAYQVAWNNEVQPPEFREQTQPGTGRSGHEVHRT